MKKSFLAIHQPAHDLVNSRPDFETLQSLVVIQMVVVYSVHFVMPENQKALLELTSFGLIATNVEHDSIPSARNRLKDMCVNCK